MAIQDLVNAGIGFDPGKAMYILTRGLDTPSSATPFETIGIGFTVTPSMSVDFAVCPQTSFEFLI